jgi:hypothetical protein
MEQLQKRRDVPVRRHGRESRLDVIEIDADPRLLVEDEDVTVTRAHERTSL